MCGIFGIVLNNTKKENIYKLIVGGLLQLQNRGYDSAGLCVFNKDIFEIYKFASTNTENALHKLVELTLCLDNNNNINIGIGHNRWATHGVKNHINAHPHLSNNKNFVIVHNGIIENYNDIKQFLINQNYHFYSQTDTEVIVNLIDYNYNFTNDTYEAISKTINKLKGTYALLIQSLHEPNKLFCVKNGSPLLVGKSKNSIIIVSEKSGFNNNIDKYKIKD